MPVVMVQYRFGLDQVVARLAKALPEIVAPNLTIEGRPLDDGSITPAEIIVRCNKGSEMDVNGKELEIIILAHDFPERKANLEERKDAIIEGVRKFFKEEDFRGVAGFVWIFLVPTAFGRL